MESTVTTVQRWKKEISSRTLADILKNPFKLVLFFCFCLFFIFCYDEEGGISLPPYCLVFNKYSVYAKK